MNKAFTEVNTLKGKHLVSCAMVLVLWFIMMGRYMKVNGKKDLELAKDVCFILMDLHIMGYGTMINIMDKEYSKVLITNTMVNG